MKLTLIAFALLFTATMSIAVETKGHGFEKKANLDIEIEHTKIVHPARYVKMRDTTAKGFHESNPMFPSRRFQYNKNGTLNLNKAHWNQKSSSCSEEDNKKRVHHRRLHNKKDRKSFSKDRKSFSKDRKSISKDKKPVAKPVKRNSRSMSRERKAHNNTTVKRVIVGDQN